MNHMRMRYSIGLLIALSAIGLPAADINWTNSAGGGFSDGANWQGGSPPGTNDIAVFDLNSAVPYKVTFTQPVTNNALRMLLDKAIFNLGGFSYTLITNSYVGTGTGKRAELVVSNGALRLPSTNQYFYVGDDSATGTLTVTGPGATLSLGTVKGFMFATKSGNTMMTIANGAVCNQAGTLQFPAYIAGFNAGYARLVIDGGLAVTTGMLAGYTGLGADVIITNGGYFRSDSNIEVSRTTSTNSSLIITGSGSVCSNTSYARVALYGNGTVVVTNGGYWYVDSYFTIANCQLATPVTGTVVVAGAGSSMSVSTLGIGGYQDAPTYDGFGWLTVSDGALFTCRGTRADLWTNATLVLDNGTFRMADGAALRLRCPSATLQGVGVLAPISGSITVTNHGVVRPTGTLVVTNGNYIQPAGKLEIALGGTGASDHGKLAVYGTMTLGGTLSVSLTNGFQPRHGDCFDILDFTSATGTFTNLNLPQGATFWSLRNLYVTGEIKYVNSGTMFSVY